MKDLFFKDIFKYSPFPQAIISLSENSLSKNSFAVISANNAYGEFIKRSTDSVAGKPVIPLIAAAFPALSSGDMERIFSSLQLAVITGSPHTIPVLYLSAASAGTQEYLKIVHTPQQSNGNITFIIQTITHITEEREHKNIPLRAFKSSNNLTEEQEAIDYLQKIIDTSQTGIFLLSPVKTDTGILTDFRFLMANRMLAGYAGQPTENIINTNGSQWFPAYLTNGLFDYYADTYVNGTTHRVDFHYEGDGIDAWLDIMSTKLNDDVLVTFSDYSTLKQLQQKMEHSLADLKKSNNNLEQFAYVASHDLQEPLRKIKSFGDILVQRHAGGLGKEGADMISRMQSAADRMKFLIEDLLTFSRISSEKTAVQQININEVIQGVLSDLEATVRDKNAIVRVSHLQPVMGNDLQLRQVFQNLLSNALKFNKKGEAPEISITSQIITGDEDGFKLPPHLGRKKFQLIRISDNGIGFEQQYAGKIFQIFQRLHGRMEYPGTGVGLSIVQKVIERHDGYIKAESEPGKGATFSILLPVPPAIAGL